MSYIAFPNISGIPVQGTPDWTFTGLIYRGKSGEFYLLTHRVRVGADKRVTLSTLQNHNQMRDSIYTTLKEMKLCPA